MIEPNCSTEISWKLVRDTQLRIYMGALVRGRNRGLSFCGYQLRNKNHLFRKGHLNQLQVFTTKILQNLYRLTTYIPPKPLFINYIHF